MRFSIIRISNNRCFSEQQYICGILDYNDSYSLKLLNTVFFRISIVLGDKANLVIAWYRAIVDWNC